MCIQEVPYTIKEMVSLSATSHSLSKENPSCLVPPWAEAALSSILDPKQRASGERSRHIPQSSLSAQAPSATWDSCEGVQHRAAFPDAHTQLHSQPGKTWRNGQMGCGQDLLVRTSVLSIHGIQVLGFNDLGQHLVAAGRRNRQEDKHWGREE